MWTLFVLGVLLCLVTIAAVGRYNEQVADEEWGALLSPEGRTAYLQLRDFWSSENGVADWSYSEAMTATGDQRLALLEASTEFLISLAPSRIEQVRRLGRFSRMAAGLAPLPPIDAASMRLPSTRRLSRLGAAVHHCLLTVAERFRLRLWVLRRGFGAVVRSLLRSQRRVAVAGAPDAEWWRIVAAREDFKTLDEETLESARVLVMALGSVDGAEVAAR